MQTLSPVIQYVYGTHDVHRIAAFNKAAVEILALLKSSEKEEIEKENKVKEKEKAELERRKKEREEIEKQIISRLPTWNGKPLYKFQKVKEPKAAVTTVKEPKAFAPKPVSRNSNYRKVYDYIVYRKLDYGEIMSFDPQFKSAQDIKQVFINLKKSPWAQIIDSIYRKYGLQLPPFSTWTAKDFNKGPSDRDELEPTNTIVYEVRRIIRDVLYEIFESK